MDYLARMARLGAFDNQKVLDAFVAYLYDSGDMGEALDYVEKELGVGTPMLKEHPDPLRPMTAGEWHSFAGASAYVGDTAYTMSELPEDKRPLIGEFGCFMVIAGREQVELYELVGTAFGGDMGEALGYFPTDKLPVPSARLIALAVGHVVAQCKDDPTTLRERLEAAGMEFPA